MKTYSTAPRPFICDTPSRAVGPTASSPASKATDRAAQVEILRRAYLLWEGEGRPENRALTHWLRAETDVRLDN